jgi:chaperone modulatory protein CbpM
MINERNLPKIHGIILEDLTELTLVELSRACAVHTDRIVQLVDEGVLFPSGVEMHHWRFSGIHLHRANVAFRLERDLGVNLAGAALALQLLDEVELLWTRLGVKGRR